MANEKDCCENCMFWRNKISWMDDDCKTVYAAECHRNPPCTNGHDTYFPRVTSDNWCGEHIGRISELDELGNRIERLDKSIGDVKQ